MEGEVNNVVSIVIYQTADWQRQGVDYLESLPCLILGECFKTLLSILEHSNCAYSIIAFLFHSCVTTFLM